MENDLTGQKRLIDKEKTSIQNNQPRTSKAVVMNESHNLAARLKQKVQTVQKMVEEVVNNYNESLYYYKLKLKTIEQHWEQVNLLHGKLVIATSEDYDFERFSEYEETVNNGILQIQQRIRDKETNQESTTMYNTHNNSNIHLPKIELPKFDGEYTKWRNFHDLYSELVDKISLPPCQKLVYLKSSLQGEAATLIRNYATTTANYAIAWKTLIDCYENKRVLVNALLNKLFAQQPPASENISSLKILHDTTYEGLRSLNNLGILGNWDPIILHFLVQRLYKTTHMLWEQSCNTPQELPSLIDFLAFIKRRFQTLETMESKQQVATKIINSFKALGVAFTNNNMCIICKQNHNIYGCPTFLKATP